jgi:hypothetical protein
MKGENGRVLPEMEISGARLDVVDTELPEGTVASKEHSKEKDKEKDKDKDKPPKPEPLPIIVPPKPSYGGV